MDNEFIPASDPEEIKNFLHNCGLIPLNEYYIQVKKMLKRQRQSSKTINEQIQKKLAENGIHKDDLSKNISLLCPRKRTSFSPVITRKRGKAIKKRTPSATQVSTITTTVITPTTTTDIIEIPIEKITNITDDDQPLDLRLRTQTINKF
ncbi:unnamed protein product [Rotaria sp. Silwood1]|nr:unnamed protein product [Rotaria sp. Silwood1]CAF1597046.1 unnamed protein product [Rotaria sp. Silwood1]CAF1606187.1 unnamed protein product [Rotaria sp. Silwood1]CAF3672470.1 unnamed protein product [Rotaria sp. Silwood1]CAF3843338.1 unnamed protein product [Rotaria sp. Silwood1]